MSEVACEARWGKGHGERAAGWFLRFDYMARPVCACLSCARSALGMLGCYAVGKLSSEVLAEVEEIDRKKQHENSPSIPCGTAPRRETMFASEQPGHTPPHHKEQ